MADLPTFNILESISSDAIIVARMAQLVATWAQYDPPNQAQYDVGNLEFDPLRINQEVGAYFETLVRDRVNQACRAVTLAFAVGGNLDAIASRYPGGVPRLSNESDSTYRTRVWLSPNTLSPNGIYESYVFFGFTAAQVAGMPLRDCQVLSTPGTPNVQIIIMADGAPITALKDGNGNYTGQYSATPSPIPSPTLISSVYLYILQPGEGRKGTTDVISVTAPKVVNINISVSVLLYPGWDVNLTMQQLYPLLAALLESQRYLGFSNTLSAITGSLKISGVFNVIINSPTADVKVNTDTVVVVNAVSLTYAGTAGFGPPSPAS